MRVAAALPLLSYMCVLTFAEKTNETKTTSEDFREKLDPPATAAESGPRVFLISPRVLFYAKGASARERIGVITGKRVGPLNVDYHAGRGELYFVSQRSGFWTRNARLFSLPWDYEFTCDGPADADNPFCKQTDSSEKFYSRVKELRLLREEENWNPRSLAVDYIADKLYIVNTGERSVNVFDLDGSNKYTVFENDTLIPLEVALDPSLGSMFILAVNIQKGVNQIYKANMDGTNRQLIVEKTEEAGNFTVLQKIGFTLDIVKKNVYFGNFEKEAFERVDYDGNSRIIVTNATNPISIGIYNDTLYWSDSDAVAMYMYLCLRIKCALYTCKLDANGTCAEGTIEPYQETSEPTFKFHAVKVVDRNSQLGRENPCGKTNGNCQHHCLLSSSAPGYSCACKNGWRLTDNRKNCTEEEEKTVYVDALVSHMTKFSEIHNSSDDRIVLMPRHLLIHLMRARSRTLFHAMPFRYLSVNARGSALIEQEIGPKDSMTGDTGKDFALGLLGFSIEANHVPSSADQDFVVLRKFSGYVGPTLAYDWVARNLYFVKLKKRGRQTGELCVLRYDKPENLTYGEYRPAEPAMTLRTIDTPVSLAVDPYRGYLFSVTSYGNIARYDLNGSGELLFPNVTNAKAVAVDLNDERLYWLSSDGYVCRTSLDGGEAALRLSRNRVALSADAFVVFDRWLFVKSNERIWRLDKATGRAAGNMGKNYENLFHESVGLRVSARDAGTRSSGSPCAEENGGCQQYCFALPGEGTSRARGRVCGCGGGYKLLEDNRSCEKLEGAAGEEEEEEPEKPDLRTEDGDGADLIRRLFVDYYKKLAILTHSII